LHPPVGSPSITIDAAKSEIAVRERLRLGKRKASRALGRTIACSCSNAKSQVRDIEFRQGWAAQSGAILKSDIGSMA
jgi:hypothetical protein